MRKRAWRVIYSSLSLVSLIIGAVVYIVSRPTVYLSKSFYSLFGEINWQIENSFVRFYLGDGLWAFSLMSGLVAIFLPTRRGWLCCSLVVLGYGVLFETFQFMGIVSGTGDWLDVFCYTLAVVTVNIINFIGGSRNEKKST